jgi:uncharacterized protein (DUF1015 family)
MAAGYIPHPGGAAIMRPMPELRPFRGVRYTALGPLKDLICPPYDVISPADQVRLYERHPYNAVRIELPFSESNHPTERYERAALQFRTWLENGVLQADETPCLYVYRQDFVVPEGAGHTAGTRGRVAGVIGALNLEAFGRDSGVLPHEHTMPGPIEDRLALLRACPVNISPIYGIYRGAGGLAPFYDSLEDRAPDARFVDYAGTLHRVWAVRKPAEIDLLSRALDPGPLVIADGHHRYETALAYHAEQDGMPGGHDAVMCFCVDADVEDLVVFPFHRAIRARVEPAQVRRRLLDRFGGKVLDHAESEPALADHDAPHPVVMTFATEDVLLEVDDSDIDEAVGGRAPQFRALDVVALHEVVLPHLFPEGIDQLVFTKEAREVRRLIEHDGWTTGALLRPPAAPDVIEVARGGERMPQKASYFWPKAVTGLVFRSLR